MQENQFQGCGNCENSAKIMRKSCTKFHFKVRKPHFKLRKALFKRVLERNVKNIRNILEFDVEKYSEIIFRRK